MSKLDISVRVRSIEGMLRSAGVEISRLFMTDSEFDEEVIWCLDHNMSSNEIIEHFNDLIEDHNSVPDSYF